MTTAVIPRFLLPRGNLLLRSRPQSALVYPIAAWPASPPCRHASNKSPPSKPIVLEKPAKFNPPSHGARLKSKAPRQYPGPPLSIQQVEEQKTKQYPHMMPPEGSFMYWFLTNRSIHVCITLGTLFSLALFTFIENFQRTSPFADMLPSADSFLSHPFSFISQYIEVYRLHTAAISAETAERRKKRVEDVQKRDRYRKAHGLENGGFGGWTAREDKDAIGPALKIDGAVGGSVTAEGAGQEQVVATTGGHGEKKTYVDFEGKKRPVRKWLGIW